MTQNQKTKKENFITKTPFVILLSIFILLSIICGLKYFSLKNQGVVTAADINTYFYEPTPDCFTNENKVGTVFYNQIPENIRNSFSNNGGAITFVKNKSDLFLEDDTIGSYDLVTNTILILEGNEKEAIGYFMGKYIDYATNNSSNSNEFDIIYNKEKMYCLISLSSSKLKTVSNSINSRGEMFAIVYSEIINNKEEIKEKCPDAYMYVMLQAEKLN